MKWTTKKPKFKKECLLMTATYFQGNWEYSTYQIKRVEFEGEWYMGWLTGDGEEYGDLKDLQSQLYCVLPLLPNPPNPSEKKSKTSNQ